MCRLFRTGVSAERDEGRFLIPGNMDVSWSFLSLEEYPIQPADSAAGRAVLGSGK